MRCDGIGGDGGEVAAPSLYFAIIMIATKRIPFTGRRSTTAHSKAMILGSRTFMVVVVVVVVAVVVVVVVVAVSELTIQCCKSHLWNHSLFIYGAYRDDLILWQFSKLLAFDDRQLHPPTEKNKRQWIRRKKRGEKTIKNNNNNNNNNKFEMNKSFYLIYDYYNAPQKLINQQNGKSLRKTFSCFS